MNSKSTKQVMQKEDKPIDSDRLDGLHKFLLGWTLLFIFFCFQNSLVAQCNFTGMDVQNASCFGASDATATVFAISPDLPLTYLWSDPAMQTTATATGLSAGLYIVTVTDNVGCSFTEQAIISEPTPLFVNTQTQDSDCMMPCDGSVIFNASGGTAPYLYQWPAGQFFGTLTGLCPGIYPISVTDSNGCSFNFDLTINSSNSTLSSIILDTQETSCNDVADGAATVSGQGGLMPYTYLWENAETTAIATMLDSGYNTFSTTDADGCVFANYVQIEAPPPLIATGMVLQHPSCGGFSDGIATIQVTGGVLGYSFNWGFASGQTESNLAPGTYAVTVIDSNGCETVTTVTLFPPDNLNVTIDQVNEIQCPDGSDGAATATVMSGTPPYSFIWSNSATTATTTGITAGFYEVTVIDSEGCEGVNGITIPQPPAFDLTDVTITPATCQFANDGSISINPTGGTQPYEFVWANGATTPSISNLAPGFYDLTLVDANGCNAITTIELGFANPSAIQIAGIITSSECGANSGSIEAVVSGGLPPYNYLWITGGTASTETGLPAGIYSVSVSDASGCEVESESFIIGNSDAPSVVDAGPGGSICFGDAVQLNGFASSPNGGIIYSWSPAIGLNDPNLPNPIAMPSATTTYTLFVTDAGGCQGFDQTTIVVSPQLGLTNIEIEEPGCDFSVGSLDLTATGGTPPYLYDWTGMGANGILEPPITVFPGTYCVTVIDSEGCTFEDCISVNGTDGPVVSLDSLKHNCGDMDGFIDISASNGVLPYTYIWTNGANTEDITNLTAGTYCITVQDNIGCIGSACYTIEDEDCVWAGDANYDGIANNTDVLALGLASDQTGPVRNFNFPEWVGIPAEDWNGAFMNGVNHKHADCDGNGIINQDDTVAISANYGLMHTVNFNPPSDNPNDPILYIELGQDTVGPASLIQLNVRLGDMDLPANDVYGLAWSINFDSDLVQPGSISTDFSGSWIGDPTESIWLSKPLDNRLDLAISRADQMNISGFGVIATIFMVIEDNVDGLIPLEDPVELLFTISDVTIINVSEQELTYSTQETTLIIDPTITSTINPVVNESITVFPNPAKDEITVRSDQFNITGIEVYNVLGLLVLQTESDGIRMEKLNTAHLSQGTYLIRTTTTAGQTIDKLIITR